MVWLLNNYSVTCRQFMNSFVSLFEQEQCEKKEKIIEALAKLVKEKN